MFKFTLSQIEGVDEAQPLNADAKDSLLRFSSLMQIPAASRFTRMGGWSVSLRASIIRLAFMKLLQYNLQVSESTPFLCQSLTHSCLSAWHTTPPRYNTTRNATRNAAEMEFTATPPSNDCIEAPSLGVLSLRPSKHDLGVAHPRNMEPTIP